MPGKMRECDGCHKIMRSDNLKNHTRKCNGLNQNLNVSNENIRYPFADNSSKMSKSINPKISALVDAIVNEEPISKDPDGSSTSKDPDDNDSGIEAMDTIAKDMKFEDEDEDDDDDDEDDDNESYSGIEPMDMTARQFEDDDEDEDDDDGIGKYVWKSDGKKNRNHSPLLPDDVRAIIVGKSGAGKSVLLAYLLLEPEMLDYDNLIVCGPSLHQPLYKIMNRGFSANLSKNQVRTIFEKQDDIRDVYDTVDAIFDDYKGKCKGGIDAQFIEDVDLIPDPSEFDVKKKNVLVLDDVLLGPQNKIEDMYTRGRHNGIDTFYIAQNYFKIPRQTVRENANIIFLFSQDMKNLNHIYNDHCSGDGISCKQFHEFCSKVWNSGKYRYVVLDLSRDVGNGKYRAGIKVFRNPKDDIIRKDVLSDLAHTISPAV